MGLYSYPRTARLLKAGDFAALRGRSKRIGARHFLAEYCSNEKPTCRLGQAVSRRVSKRAVERNRIKRVVRESYRHVRGQLSCVDILLIARSSAANTPSTDLRDDLASLWKKFATLKATQGTGTMRG